MKAFGVPAWKGFNQNAYAQVLGNAKAAGVNIWNGAYVQNQKYATHLPTKHQRYLALVEYMMRNGVTHRLQAAKTYKDAFRVLQRYPLHAKSFLPMQHLTDLNYSEVIDFDENELRRAWTGSNRRYDEVFRKPSRQRRGSGRLAKGVSRRSRRILRILRFGTGDTIRSETFANRLPESDVRNRQVRSCSSLGNRRWPSTYDDKTDAQGDRSVTGPVFPAEVEGISPGPNGLLRPRI